MSALRVAVIGAGGRLGSYACVMLEASSDFELVGRYTSADDWPTLLGESGVRVALDATVAGLGAKHGLLMLERSVRPVIGTSGVTEDELTQLDSAAREMELGGLVVPNFSLGIWVLQNAVREAARRFDRVEIVERHHDGKKDAPSATALSLARTIRDARGDATGEVPIHAVRLPGLYAQHEVLLSGAGEVLSLRHEASGPSAFGPGLRAALTFASTVRGVERGLDSVFRGGED